jgi:hypothetical protein
MPILGTIASSTRQGQATDLGAMFPLQVITVGAPTSSITFTNIPSTYTHLQLRYIARTARANQEDNIYLRFNSDTGNNYAGHSLYGDGATAGSFSEGTSISYNTRTVVAAASSAANTFGVGVTEILDYASTSKNKTVRSLNGYDNNGSGQVRITSGLWINNTTAITSITIASANSAAISQYSQFALYGVKSA